LTTDTAVDVATSGGRGRNYDTTNEGATRRRTGLISRPAGEKNGWMAHIGA